MRRILTIAAICLLVGALGGVTLAQETVNSALYGKVVDLATGKPINSAAVVATSVYGAFTATTDSKGYYHIPALKPGSYDVRVEASGYATIIQEEVKLALGGRTELN